MDKACSSDCGAGGLVYLRLNRRRGAAADQRRRRCVSNGAAGDGCLDNHGRLG
jgi:hypothetical protein